MVGGLDGSEMVGRFKKKTMNENKTTATTIIIIGHNKLLLSKTYIGHRTQGCRARYCQ